MTKSEYDYGYEAGEEARAIEIASKYKSSSRADWMGSFDDFCMGWVDGFNRTPPHSILCKRCGQPPDGGCMVRSCDGERGRYCFSCDD